MGIKTRMVVKEEVSSGTERVVPVSIQASRFSWPFSRRVRMSSAMTMPLSTSMPSAMMEEAMETRSSSISKKRMATMPKSMVMGTNEPTISPVRMPRNNMTTTRTITRV